MSWFESVSPKRSGVEPAKPFNPSQAALAQVGAKTAFVSLPSDPGEALCDAIAATEDVDAIAVLRRFQLHRTGRHAERAPRDLPILHLFEQSIQVRPQAQRLQHDLHRAAAG